MHLFLFTNSAELIPELRDPISEPSKSPETIPKEFIGLKVLRDPLNDNGVQRIDSSRVIE
jgi:hypothetical protein